MQDEKVFHFAKLKITYLWRIVKLGLIYLLRLQDQMALVFSEIFDRNRSANENTEHDTNQLNRLRKQ